jgi:hypothetical protein
VNNPSLPLILREGNIIVIIKNMPKEKPEILKYFLEDLLQ